VSNCEQLSVTASDRAVVEAKQGDPKIRIANDPLMRREISSVSRPGHGNANVRNVPFGFEDVVAQHPVELSVSRLNERGGTI